MGVMMNLIMLGCTYPIVLIMYVFMKLEIGDKKKTVLGIAVPEEFRKDPQVLEICGQFRKSMRLGLIVMLIFPAVFFWMPWFTLYITGYLIWVYLMIGVELYPMAKYGERLKELKRKRGWGRADCRAACPRCKKRFAGSFVCAQCSADPLGIGAPAGAGPEMGVYFDPRHDGEYCLAAQRDADLAGPTEIRNYQQRQ